MIFFINRINYEIHLTIIVDIIRKKFVFRLVRSSRICIISHLNHEISHNFEITPAANKKCIRFNKIIKINSFFTSVCHTAISLKFCLIEYTNK
jgi:hypothetical protein